MYCLSVSPTGVFFADGVLVSNCDALRYVVAHLDAGAHPVLAVSGSVSVSGDDAMWSEAW